MIDDVTIIKMGTYESFIHLIEGQEVESLIDYVTIIKMGTYESFIHLIEGRKR